MPFFCEKRQIEFVRRMSYDMFTSFDNLFFTIGGDRYGAEEKV